jgi:hypothetical protein
MTQLRTGMAGTRPATRVPEIARIIVKMPNGFMITYTPNTRATGTRAHIVHLLAPTTSIGTHRIRRARRATHRAV